MSEKHGLHASHLLSSPCFNRPLVFPPAATIPLRLRRSPVLKRRPEASGEPRPAAEAGGEERGGQPELPVLSQSCAQPGLCGFAGTAAQERLWAAPDETRTASSASHGERPPAAAQTVVCAQDSAVDQRSPVQGLGEPALGQ